MDYGGVNSILGRKVESKFWGTRLEHILGVAAALAVTDHSSAAIFEKFLGKGISFADTPAAFIAHTFFFIFVGVVLYAAGMFESVLLPKTHLIFLIHGKF